MLNLSATEPLDDDPVRLCQSIGELIAVTELMHGRELALQVLHLAQIERQPLEHAARELRRVGKVELAKAVAELAATAPKASWWRGPRRPGRRWRTRSAQIVLDRKRAERRAAKGR